MESRLTTATDQSFEYTFDYNKYFFAYPSALGSIVSVIDQNGFEILSGFVESIIEIEAVDYTVLTYVWELTVENYTITFKYTL